MLRSFAYRLVLCSKLIKSRSRICFKQNDKTNRAYSGGTNMFNQTARCHVISERDRQTYVPASVSETRIVATSRGREARGRVIATMTSRPFHCPKLCSGVGDFSPRGSVTAWARLALSVPKLHRLTRHSLKEYVKNIEANFRQGNSSHANGPLGPPCVSLVDFGFELLTPAHHGRHQSEPGRRGAVRVLCLRYARRHEGECYERKSNHVMSKSERWRCSNQLIPY